MIGTTRHVFGDGSARTLQWATAVAVFFLPKHWTLCVDMFAVCDGFRKGEEEESVKASREQGEKRAGLVRRPG